MEKYKLKKDTFFYKAGTICKLTPKGNMVLDDCEGTCILHNYQLKEYPELIDEWFEKIEEKKYGGRVPKDGAKFYYIAPGGAIIRREWVDGGTCESMFECGSAFWTEEEAEKELKRRKAYVILKEDTKGFEPSADLTGDCYTAYYSLYSHSFDVVRQNAWGTRGILCFATYKDAQDSIIVHRQEWLDYLQLEETE